MSPFQVYKFYLAIKLHFTEKRYDVFKYHGAVNAGTEESFMQRNGHGRFVQLARRFKTPQEAVQFFVACFAYGSDVFDAQASEEALSRWRKHKEMTTQLIMDDLETLSLPQVLDGEPCKLQKLVSGGMVNVETVVALNRYYKFAEKWKNNFVYSSLGVKIDKLDPFVKYNEGKVNEFIAQHEQPEATLVS
jgi:hypothetical protein